MPSVADREESTIYVDGRIVFVPHYRKRGVFVAPGGSEWAESELILRGLRRTKTYLWPVAERWRKWVTL